MVLAGFCGLALLFERFILNRGDDDDGASQKEALDDAASSTGGLVKAADRLGLSYLGVYAVVMGMCFSSGVFVSLLSSTAVSPTRTLTPSLPVFLVSHMLNYRTTFVDAPPVLNSRRLVTRALRVFVIS